MTVFKKGEKVHVECNRKGPYDAEVYADFDTATDTWAHVKLDQQTPIMGITTFWERGDEVPCRLSEAKITRR